LKQSATVFATLIDWHLHTFHLDVLDAGREGVASRTDNFEPQTRRIRRAGLMRYSHPDGVQ
jgi:hypothetical protein